MLFGAISSLINRNAPLRTSPSVLVKVKKSMILSETLSYVCDNKWVNKQKLAAVLALPAVVLHLCLTLVQFEPNKGLSGKRIHYFIEACWICFISRLCWFVVSVFRENRNAAISIITKLPDYIFTGIEAHHYSVMRAHLFDRQVCRHTHSMQ